MSYDDYLNSAQWKATRHRKVVSEIHRGVVTCSDCQRPLQRHETEVHHETYVHIGEEREDELNVLCDDCHAKRHGKIRSLFRRCPLPELLFSDAKMNELRQAALNAIEEQPSANQTE